MWFKSLYSISLLILFTYSVKTASSNEVNGVPLSVVTDLADPDYDAVIHVAFPTTTSAQNVTTLQNVMRTALTLDKGAERNPSAVFVPSVAGGRLIIAPTGAIGDYDDVRSICDAARTGMQRAISAGSRRPILVVQSSPDYPDAELVLLLCALEQLYVPIEIREWFPERSTKLQSLGVYAEGPTKPVDALIFNAVRLEYSRAMSRDIAAGDPERMAAIRVEKYVREKFASSISVAIKVIDDQSTIKKEYPLFAAVTRAADTVERHRGNIIFLEYTPEGPPEHTVILVGKGITYDSGGVNIKTGGGMVSMSRDKSGAATVAGFVKACELLKPNIKVIGVMCMARNSIGEEGYVPDELILSRNGKTVRVNNADAEGRMVMGDLLAEMKDRAQDEVNAHIYSIATLTGHASSTVGAPYTIALDNHVARKTNHASAFRASGEALADMVEISTVRREDFASQRGRAEGDDVVQSGSHPTNAGARGHQSPTAFLMLVSGLNEGTVPYTHLDIAASYGALPNRSTAATLLAFANHYNLIKY